MYENGLDAVTDARTGLTGDSSFRNTRRTWYLFLLVVSAGEASGTT